MRKFFAALLSRSCNPGHILYLRLDCLFGPGIAHTNISATITFYSVFTTCAITLARTITGLTVVSTFSQTLSSSQYPFIHSKHSSSLHVAQPSVQDPEHGSSDSQFITPYRPSLHQRPSVQMSLQVLKILFSHDFLQSFPHFLQY